MLRPKEECPMVNQPLCGGLLIEIPGRGCTHDNTYIRYIHIYVYTCSWESNSPLPKVFASTKSLFTSGSQLFLQPLPTAQPNPLSSSHIPPQDTVVAAVCNVKTLAKRDLKHPKGTTLLATGLFQQFWIIGIGIKRYLNLI